MTSLTPKEVSCLLNKSLRWVYSHGAELNGSLIGGTWIFTEEGLQNAIQTGQEVARRRKNRGQADSSKISFLTEKRRCRMGTQREKEREEAARRHGLDDLLH